MSQPDKVISLFTIRAKYEMTNDSRLWSIWLEEPLGANNSQDGVGLI